MKKKLLIGLAASVEPDGRGSFRPRYVDTNTKPLLANARWKGFASALQAHFAEHLVILGGIELLPHLALPGDTRSIGNPFEQDGKILREVGSAYATCHGLVHNYGIEWEKLSYVETDRNTLGNIGSISHLLLARHCAIADAMLSSSHYHIARISMDMVASGLGSMMIVPAEAFWLATGPKGQRREMEEFLRNEFGNSQLTERVIAELNGAADKLNEQYNSLSS